jgi:hypothetical protein
MKPATAEPLYTCPVCRQPNFSRRGLRAHCCHAKPGRARLTAYELIKAAVCKVPACEPATPVSQSQPMSNSPKKHALALLAQPEFAVAKDDLKKLQATAVAQVRAVAELEAKAGMGACIAGMTLLRVKHSTPHGKFGAWIEANAKHGVGHRQANYYMRLALVFLEKARVQKPDLLALPGDQLSLDVGDNHAAKQLLAKLQKFVGDLSLTELLIKHGIKGVGLKTELESGRDDEEEGDKPAPGQAEDYFAEVADRVYGFRQLVTSRENLARLTPQQLETLNQTVTDSYSEFRRLYDEARGKASAVTV